MPLLAAWPPFVCTPVAVVGVEKELGAVAVSPAVGQGTNSTKTLLTDVLLTIFFLNLNFFRQSHAFTSPVGRM